jgi:hypothetical protein
MNKVDFGFGISDFESKKPPETYMEAFFLILKPAVTYALA